MPKSKIERMKAAITRRNMKMLDRQHTDDSVFLSSTGYKNVKICLQDAAREEDCEDVKNQNDSSPWGLECPLGYKIAHMES